MKTLEVFFLIKAQIELVKIVNLKIHITKLENLTMPLLDWLSFLKSLSIKDQHCFINSSISLFESDQTTLSLINLLNSKYLLLLYFVHYNKYLLIES